MPKDQLVDYDSVAANNTDIGGISTDEGMLPSNVNDAFREQMSHLADFAAGTSGINVLSLTDDTDTNQIKIQAPSSVTTTTTFTLPDGDGTSGQSLTTNGSGTLSWSSSTGTVEIDLWHLPSDHTTNATITAWARPTYTGYAKAGTGMTHSSGIFTFPSTGLWKVVFSFRTNLVSTDTSAGAIIDLSTNTGSSFTEISGAFENRNSNSSLHTQALINCTNTSTFQVRFRSTALDSGGKISGHASRLDTNVLFERITDSQ